MTYHARLERTFFNVERQVQAAHQHTELARLAARLAAIGEKISRLESDGRNHDSSVARLRALRDERQALWTEYMELFKAQRQWERDQKPGPEGQ